jgi:hypothetical protein
MVTSTDIVNQAIQLIGDNQTPVTGTYPTFDSSPAGVAAASLYLPTVETVGRRFGWDFSRTTAALVLSGNTAPFPWTVEYLYPNGIQVRQLNPPTLADPFNPLPIRWEVANSLVGGIPTKVIQTNLPNAQVMYTNVPSENLWDSIFRETVVRMLASSMAMAIAGKPDTSRDTLDQSAAFEQVGQERQD